MTKEKLIADLKRLRKTYEEVDYMLHPEFAGLCYFTHCVLNWEADTKVSPDQNMYCVISQLGEKLNFNKGVLFRHERREVIDLLEHDLIIAAEYLWE